MSSDLWGWVIWTLEWIIRLVVLISVTRQRPPTSAIAWLLVVFFYPLVGLPLYLLIGHNKLPKSRVEQWRRLKEKLRVRNVHAPRVTVQKPVLTGRLAQTVRLAERLGDMPVVGGNDGEVFSDSAKVIARLVEDLEQTRKHAHLEFYIFADDRAGQQVQEALKRAAGRGVKCRLIVDSVGSAKFLKQAAPRLRQAGVEVVEALPVGRFRRQAARFDLRNHRKLAVFDGKVGYAGSQNIVEPHYGHKDLVWHDVMCRLQGPIVLEMQTLFLSDWCFETEEILEGEDLFPTPSPAGPVPMQLLPSGPTYAAENFQRVVVDAVHEAEERVILTTPYLVPDQPLLQALQVAVLSGARVDVVVPRRSDSRLTQWAGESYYQELLEMGVRVHLFEKGLLHAKTLTIDRCLTLVGSSNFDIRSFALNFEVNVVIYGEDTLGLRALQERYLEDSTELSLASWSGQPAWKQVRRNVCRLLSPLL